MSAFLSNPILYAQFQSRGGWRRLWLSVGIYTAAMAALIALMAYNAGKHYQEVLEGWLPGLLGLQALILVVFGTMRVSGAVRSDLQSQMLESHRLMPMPRSRAIVGYLLGAPSHAIALGAANLILGFAILPLIHSPQPSRWLVANFMLGWFALMLWAISALIAFSVRGGVIIMTVAGFLLLANSGQAFNILPAVSLLTYPIVGRSVFRMDTAVGDIQTAYGLSLIGQGAIIAICCAAAARKYRSTDGVGFNAPLGLALLAAGVGMSMVAIAEKEVFQPYWRWMRDDAPARFAAAVVTSVMLSLVPLASSARARAPRFRRAAKPAGAPTALVAVAAIVLVLLLLTVSPRPIGGNFNAAAGETAIIVAAAVFSYAALFRCIYKIQRSAWQVASAWFAIVWLVPLAVQAAQDFQRNVPPTSLAYTFSPIGALACAWNDDPALARPGILFQLGMLGVAVALFLLANRNRPAARAV